MSDEDESTTPASPEPSRPIPSGAASASPRLSISGQENVQNARRMSQLREQLSMAQSTTEADVTKQIEEQLAKSEGPWFDKFASHFAAQESKLKQDEDRLESMKSDFEENSNNQMAALKQNLETLFESDLAVVRKEHDEKMGELSQQVLKEMEEMRILVEKEKVVNVETWLTRFVGEQTELIKGEVFDKTDKKQEYQKAIETAGGELNKILTDHLDKTVALIKSDDNVMKTNFGKLKENLDSIVKGFLNESKLRDSAIVQMEGGFEVALRETKKQQEVGD